VTPQKYVVATSMACLAHEKAHRWAMKSTTICLSTGVANVTLGGRNELADRSERVNSVISVLLICGLEWRGVFSARRFCRLFCAKADSQLEGLEPRPHFFALLKRL
jgi:hypothetical protein